MAKKLYNKSEARIRLEYSKISSEIRKQVKDLRAEMPNARVLGGLTITDFAGLRARKKMGLSDSPKHLKDLTRTLKKLRKSRVLDVKANDRAERAAAETLRKDGYGDIEPGDVKKLFAFLDYVADAGLNSIYDSEHWIKVFQRSKKRGFSIEELKGNVDAWAGKLEKTGELKKTYLKRR